MLPKLWQLIDKNRGYTKSQSVGQNQFMILNRIASISRTSHVKKVFQKRPLQITFPLNQSEYLHQQKKMTLQRQSTVHKPNEDRERISRGNVEGAIQEEGTCRVDQYSYQQEGADSSESGQYVSPIRRRYDRM